VKSVLRWAVPLVVSAGVALGVAHAATSSSVVAANWPATCTFSGPSCGNNHLNNLDGRMRQQGALIVSLRARIKNDEAKFASLQQALQNTLGDSLGCYGLTPFAEYPATANTTNGNTPPGSDPNTEGGTYLDVEHQDNPANNRVYWILRDFCKS
jgi:hypothetical protein